MSTNYKLTAARARKLRDSSIALDSLLSGNCFSLQSSVVFFSPIRLMPPSENCLPQAQQSGFYCQRWPPAPLPMRSTRLVAHHGAGMTQSMTLLEMIWLFTEVLREVQIGWREGKTEEGLVEGGPRIISTPRKLTPFWHPNTGQVAFVINVLDDKTDAIATFSLNTSKSPGQPGGRNKTNDLFKARFNQKV
ncbi:predicted protein [Postia placenta Mad-698-R]|nr:predicted protein [Postia placenta Mad-698-R]